MAARAPANVFNRSAFGLIIGIWVIVTITRSSYEYRKLLRFPSRLSPHLMNGRENGIRPKLDLGRQHRTSDVPARRMGGDAKVSSLDRLSSEVMRKNSYQSRKESSKGPSIDTTTVGMTNIGNSFVDAGIVAEATLDKIKFGEVAHHVTDKRPADLSDYQNPIQSHHVQKSSTIHDVNAMSEKKKRKENVIRLNGQPESSKVSGEIRLANDFHEESIPSSPLPERQDLDADKIPPKRDEYIPPSYIPIQKDDDGIFSLLQHKENATNPCTCSIDPQNRVSQRSGRLGCFESVDIVSGKSDLVCYVTGGMACERAQESYAWPGLFWRHCSSEDQAYISKMSSNGALHQSSIHSRNSCTDCQIANGKLKRCKQSCDSSTEVLRLTHKNIRVISANAFQGLDNLKEIDLSNNAIEVIEEKAFDGLPHLEMFRIHDNPIALPVKGMMKGVPVMGGYPGLPTNIFDSIAPMVKLYFHECCWYASSAVAGFLRDWQNVPEMYYDLS